MVKKGCYENECFGLVRGRIKLSQTNLIIATYLEKEKKYDIETLSINRGARKFYSNIDSLLPNINNQHPACSIVIGDLNVKCSKWCTTDKDNTAGLELCGIATTAGYSQIINKPTHFINES